MTQDRPQPRIRFDWRDIDARPLPDGYVNIFRDDDGNAMVTRCPALIVQVCMPYWTASLGTLTADQMRTAGIDPEYLDRRVVAADLDAGLLTDATDADNYVGTLHRDELDAALRHHGLTLPEPPA